MNNRNESIHPISPSFIGDRGLTKREYFAAMALQGLLSRVGDYSRAAEQAAHHADALLKELDK